MSENIYNTIKTTQYVVSTQCKYQLFPLPLQLWWGWWLRLLSLLPSATTAIWPVLLGIGRELVEALDKQNWLSQDLTNLTSLGRAEAYFVTPWKQIWKNRLSWGLNYSIKQNSFSKIIELFISKSWNDAVLITDLRHTKFLAHMKRPEPQYLRKKLYDVYFKIIF